MEDTAKELMEIGRLATIIDRYQGEIVPKLNEQLQQLQAENERLKANKQLGLYPIVKEYRIGGLEEFTCEECGHINSIDNSYVEKDEIKNFNYDLLTAIQALQEKLERENPQPLGLEELRKMDGEPVWIEIIGKPDLNCWGYHDEDGVNGYTRFTSDDDYGKTWLAYRHKPDSVDANKIECEANDMVEGE